MTTSGEAADQVVRMMLEGSEVLIKLTGTGAKNAAVLLYSILKGQKQTRGKARLTAMLGSGQPLKVYSFRREDLEKFKESAKQYGVLYTVLKDKDDRDGMFDVLVRAQDEGKILRIMERFKLVGVDTAAVRAELQKEKELAAKKGKGSPADEKTESAADTEAEGTPNDGGKEEPVPTQTAAERNLSQLDAVQASQPSPVSENPSAARVDEQRENTKTAEGLAVPSKENGQPPLTTSSPTSTDSPVSASPSEPKSKSVRDSSGRISVRAEIERKKAERAAAAKAAPVKVPEAKIPAGKDR